MAEVMRATAMRTMPSASASTPSVPPIPAARLATAARASLGSMLIVPPKRLAPPMRPSTTLASVTVASVPPWPYAAGPGAAPALRGPTWRLPSTSSHAIEPPPAPTLCMSSWGTLTGKAPSMPSDVVSGRSEEADVGRGAAHVVGDEVADAGGGADEACLTHTAGRAREDRLDRQAARRLGRHHAAARCD